MASEFISGDNDTVSVSIRGRGELPVAQWAAAGVEWGDVTDARSGTRTVVHISDGGQLVIEPKSATPQAVQKQESELLQLQQALLRAERKLSAYVGICSGDKELTGTVLPMVRAALGMKPEIVAVSNDESSKTSGSVSTARRRKP